MHVVPPYGTEPEPGVDPHKPSRRLCDMLTCEDRSSTALPLKAWSVDRQGQYHGELVRNTELRSLPQPY